MRTLPYPNSFVQISTENIQMAGLLYHSNIFLHHAQRWHHCCFSLGNLLDMEIDYPGCWYKVWMTAVDYFPLPKTAKCWLTCSSTCRHGEDGVWDSELSFIKEASRLFTHCSAHPFQTESDTGKQKCPVEDSDADLEQEPASLTHSWKCLKFITRRLRAPELSH